MGCCTGRALPPKPEEATAICRNCKRDNRELLQKNLGAAAAKVSRSQVVYVPIKCPCGFANSTPVFVKRG